MTRNEGSTLEGTMRDGSIPNEGRTREETLIDDLMLDESRRREDSTPAETLTGGWTLEGTLSDESIAGVAQEETLRGDLKADDVIRSEGSTHAETPTGDSTQGGNLGTLRGDSTADGIRSGGSTLDEGTLRSDASQETPKGGWMPGGTLSVAWTVVGETRKDVLIPGETLEEILSGGSTPGGTLRGGSRPGGNLNEETLRGETTRDDLNLVANLNDKSSVMPTGARSDVRPEGQPPRTGVKPGRRPPGTRGGRCETPRGVRNGERMPEKTQEES